jgi:hypothetical protein
MVDPGEYIGKFPELAEADVRKYAVQFNAIDKDRDGALNQKELLDMFREAKLGATGAQISDYIKEYDKDGDGKLNFGEFLGIFVQERKVGKTTSFGDGLREHAAMIKVSGSVGSRMFSQEEVSGFVQYINEALAGDKDLEGIIPINPEDVSLFKAVGNGILLCKMCNVAIEGTIDERVIATGKKLNTYSLLGNITLALSSARGIGIQTVNIGPPDIRDGTPHLVLGLTWQLVRLALTAKISLRDCPELFRLLKPGETIEQFLKLSPEEILLRWLNYHLEKAGSARRATNFSGDIKDSEIYTVVMHQIAPECSTSPLRETEPLKRAKLCLDEAAKIDCKKFVGPREIVNGNPRLNLAFVANLFNTRPGLEPLTEAELASINEALFAAGGTRLERQFCLWLNSYGFDPLITDLGAGLADGEVLLALLDKIEPGCVDWKRVGKGKASKFRSVQSLDYALEIAKGLGLVIVGISGNDIYDSNMKLVLAVMWQLMRYDYLKTFKKLGGGARIKDEQIVAWANEKSAGKGITITGFGDDQIKNSRPILAVLDVVKPQNVDWALFEEDPDPGKMKRNAMYALSIIRKEGGTLFALPEDIVEGKAKMIMTVYASLMALGGE